MFLAGPVLTTLLRLAAPTVALMLLQAVIAAGEAAFVGRLGPREVIDADSTSWAWSRPGGELPDSCKVPPTRWYPQVWRTDIWLLLSRTSIGPAVPGRPRGCRRQRPQRSESAARNEAKGAWLMTIGTTSPAEGKVGKAKTVAFLPPKRSTRLGVRPPRLVMGRRPTPRACPGRDAAGPGKGRGLSCAVCKTGVTCRYTPSGGGSEQAGSGRGEKPRRRTPVSSLPVTPGTGRVSGPRRAGVPAGKCRCPNRGVRYS
jgi:hypothetical protein